MLQLADLVKFAKAEPPVERHESIDAIRRRIRFKKLKRIPVDRKCRKTLKRQINLN